MSLRVAAGVALTIWLIARPVHLSSSRWWQVPEIAQSLGLTRAQRDAIDRIYERQLGRRRSCVERFASASQRVSQLIRDGGYDDVLKETEAAAAAAAEERMWTRTQNDEIRTLLTPEQRDRLSRTAAIFAEE